MVVTTSAIVLSARKQGETSKIVTLYTAAYGKLNVIAKGARELRSKFGGALEAFALSDVVFYYKKDTGGLCLISKAETVRSNAGILKSLERIETASQIVELITRAMHDEEENPNLFALLAETMNGIATHSEESLKAILIYFFLRFIEISGFRLNLAEIPSSDTPNAIPNTLPPKTQVCFKIKTGELTELHIAEDDRNPHFGNDMIPIYAESIGALRFIESATLEKASSLRMSQRAFANLSEIFSAFFSEHFEGLHKRALKSTGSLTRR